MMVFVLVVVMLGFGVLAGREGRHFKGWLLLLLHGVALKRGWSHLSTTFASIKQRLLYLLPPVLLLAVGT